MSTLFRITNLDTNETRDLQLADPKVIGWNEYVLGWSLGGVGSNADIELSEPLDGAEIGVFLASNHVILWGRFAPSARIPAIRLRDEDRVWTAEADKNKLEFRFDRHPLLIGRHLIEMP